MPTKVLSLILEGVVSYLIVSVAHIAMQAMDIQKVRASLKTCMKCTKCKNAAYQENVDLR